MQGIHIQDLTKRYDKKTVVDYISFHIPEGEIFGLIGPNGAGKSTTIKMMTGLTKPTSGIVTVDGQGFEKDDIAIKKKLGVVPQDIALVDDINAVDNLDYFGRLYHLKGKDLKKRIDDVLELTGLQDHRKKKVKTYSGGMKRRLNLAASLMHNPKYLILDEPTVGVDPQSRNAIFSHIKELNKQGTTVLYTSHYMEEVEALCDQIFIMDGGKEVAYGSKDSLRKMLGDTTEIKIALEDHVEHLEEKITTLAGVQKVEQTDANHIALMTNSKDFHLSELIRIVESAGGNFASIYIEEPSLEEIFLRLTGKNLRD